MIRIITLFLLSFLIFSSCTKENEDYFDDSNGLPTIKIDSLKYSYISADNEYFYKDIFKSSEHIQNFNLQLNKNRKYRISSSQEFNEYSAIGLELLASNNQTITISQDLNGQKVLYFNSSEYQTLLLHAQLQNEYNISLDYKLFFEELEYSRILLNDIQVSYYGHFSTNLNDTLSFYPSNSYWYRFIKTDNIVSNTADISYTFKSSIENQSQEFGFSLGASDRYYTENEFINDLPNGIFFSVKENKYTITQVEEATKSIIESGSLPTDINYNSNIKIEIQSDNAYSNKKNIFINNELVTFIDCPEMNHFYTIFSDRAASPIQIFDYTISQ